MIQKTTVEVDFYVPEDELAIQVSYSISKDKDTWETIEDEYGTIEVIPCWKWLLGI